MNVCICTRTHKCKQTNKQTRNVNFQQNALKLSCHGASTLMCTNNANVGPPNISLSKCHNSFASPKITQTHTQHVEGIPSIAYLIWADCSEINKNKRTHHMKELPSHNFDGYSFSTQKCVLFLNMPFSWRFFVENFYVAHLFFWADKLEIVSFYVSFFLFSDKHFSCGGTEMTQNHVFLFLLSLYSIQWQQKLHAKFPICGEKDRAVTFCHMKSVKS